MRIVHALAGLDPEAGGLPPVVTHLSAAQAALGHNVSIACCRVPGAEERTAAELATVPFLDRVKIEYLAPLTRMELLLGHGTRRNIGPAISRGEIVHTHGVWDQFVRITALAARKCNVPYVITPHGMLNRWSLQQRPLKKKLALALGYRAMLEHAAFIHALNDDEADSVRALHLPTAIRCIPNAISLEEYEQLPAPDEFGKIRPEIGNSPYVLFLGRLHPKKGMNLLVDSFARVAAKVPRLRLVVAGPDRGGLAQLNESTARWNLGNRVHVTGTIVGREKLAALSGALCFCLPSEDEGFSMAILEALACGAVPVISQESHFPEVQQAGAGFVLPRQAEAFSDAIEKLNSDPTFREQMAQRGHALVKERYTWESVARTAIEAYGSVLRR